MSKKLVIIIIAAITLCNTFMIVYIMNCLETQVRIETKELQIIKQLANTVWERK